MCAVESNADPPAPLNDKTETCQDTVMLPSGKRRRVGPTGGAATTPAPGGPGTASGGLAPPAQERSEVAEWHGPLLTWNCSELRVASARRICTRYSGLPTDAVVLRKVRQPDGVRRFDLSLRCAEPRLRDVVRRLGRALKARIRASKPKAARVPRPPPPRPVLGEGSVVSVMTFNVNGYQAKRAEVHLELRRVRPLFLALQETRRAAVSRVRVPAYQTLETQMRGPGARGLLLGVRRGCGLELSELETTDWFIAGRADGVSDVHGRISVLVYSVHIPASNDAGRAEAKMALTRSVRKAWCVGNYAQIVLAGDFNMPPAMVDHFLDQIDIGLARVGGYAVSRVGPAGGSSVLDHVAVWRASAGPAEARVLTDVDLSDHLPVVASWSLGGRVQVVPRLRCDASGLVGNEGVVKEDVRWTMAQGAEDGGDATQAFLDVSRSIQSERGLVREVGQVREDGLLSSRSVNLIRARRKMAQLRGTPAFAEAVYKQLWDDSKRSVKEDARALRAKRLGQLCEDGASNRFKDLWRGLDSLCGTVRAGGIEGPLLDKAAGVLVHAASEKERVCAAHFGALAADPDGVSKDEAFWRAILPDAEHEPVRAGCDDPLTWAEVRTALAALSRGKAPGLDLMPAELLKLCQDEEEPRSELGKAVRDTVARLWNGTRVPACVGTSVVVPVPKKGPREDLDNYRGIALMPAIVKLVSKIATSRLQAIAERDGLLAVEQAGFRTSEECVAQATALYEVVRRRSISRLPTLALFVDFAKAYDTVPHEGLLRKLRSVGIGGRLLGVFRALYEDPKLCVRTGDGHSPAVPYLRGVRQGCPASPILFDLYINDILAGMPGVSVPGLAERLPGLLFADDAVILAESEDDLARAATMVEAWAARWGMRVNAAKCAVVAFPALEATPITLSRPVLLGGAAVEQRASYTYLGVELDTRLSWATMLQRVCGQGRKTLEGLRCVLRDASIPAHLKLVLIRSKLLPVLTYGAELWGMNTAVSAGAQRILDAAARLVMRAGKATSLPRLRAELGLPTVAAAATARRWRAMNKFPALKTWIARLCACMPPGRQSTWVTGSKRWVNTYAKDCGQGATGKRRLLEIYGERSQRRDHTLATAWAAGLGLSGTGPWVQLGEQHPALARHLLEVGRMRLGVFPLGKRLVYQRRLDERFLRRCPFCPNSAPETLEHFLLACPQWEVARQKHLAGVLSVGAAPGTRSPAALTLAVGELLGGEQGTGRSSGGGGSSVAAQSGERSPSAVQGQRVVRLAGFLAEVVPRRWRLLSALGVSAACPSSWNRGHSGMVALQGP